MNDILSKTVIFKVYHNTKLLDEYPFEKDGIRFFVNTQNNEYGPYLNEYCALEKVKSLPEEIKYVGLEHYRRTFEEITPKSLSTLEEYLFKPQSCLVENFYFSINDENYCEKICGKQLYKIVSKFFSNGKFQKEAKLLDKNRLLISKEMFIMKREDVLSMTEFIDEVITYIFKELGIRFPKDIEKVAKRLYPKKKDHYYGNRNRCFGYLIEVLIDIWIRANLSPITFDLLKDGRN